MTDINVFAGALRSIEYHNDEQWFSKLLGILPIPKSTKNRLYADLESSEIKHVKILNRAEFVISNESLYSKLISTNEKKVVPLVFHINRGKITVFQRYSQISSVFDVKEIAEHIDEFLELIYGNLIRRDIQATQNFAATIAQLSNQLKADNTKCNPDLCSKFVLDIATISIAHSFVSEITFEAFSKKALEKDFAD